jgi:PKD repeat protein
MSIPLTSSFPTAYDTDKNLFLVHDSLRVRLAEDYDPGDTTITVSGDTTDFPENGFITLTEQLSDIEFRAISLYYSSKTDTTFENLTLCPGFVDTIKPKDITHVTQNVMSYHHNALKNALIAVQRFIGVEGAVDTKPFGTTLSGKINFLNKLILTPKAWFSMDRTVGIVPLCVTFTDESLRLGSGEVIYIWSFGEDTSVISGSISTASNMSIVNGATIQKCFSIPGIYDVSLKVINEYGEDIVKFERAIDARIGAPNEAVIDFTAKSSQHLTPGQPTGGPYTTPPKIKSATNVFIDVRVKSGENPNTPGRSYAGELLNGHGSAIDPITAYTWNLSDDLSHSNSHIARAIYSVGGIYNVELRVDTELGAYRITTYEDVVDIVEQTNLWLWTFTSESYSGGIVRANEFGLISETFKSRTPTLLVNRNNSFLDYLGFAPFTSGTEAKAKKEFARNTMFSGNGTTTSGEHGDALLFWSSGGNDVEHQKIIINKFNGFLDTYESETSIDDKPWNWAALCSETDAYFIFGTQEFSTPPYHNYANPEKTTYSLEDQSYTSVPLTASDFNNGADVLLEHISKYTDIGIPKNGYFAVYRTAWKDQTGYLVRNSAINEFFRLSGFYKTEGTISDPFLTMTRLPDVGGVAKTEGQLVPMSNGIFFFNNSGDISAYNEASGVWEKAGPTLGSVSFRTLQDSSVNAYDNIANTLLATSDKEHRAYLSYDYSSNAFIKFNNVDLTFSSAGSRPSGTQFIMGIY